MNHHTIIGIDLAKNVFQVAVMKNNRIQSNQRVNRKKLTQLIANHPKTTIAMEACYSSHYWGRLFESYGHKVLLIPAQHVKPFTRGNKTDANDAVAIIEASQRPDLRFVPVKTVYQQDIQNLHRIRERLVGNRTALTNQTRGLLAEYGIVFAVGKKAFLLGIERALNDASLSELFKAELRLVLDELRALAKHISQIEDQLASYVKHNEDCQILHSIPGIGIINASALVCKYGNGAQFDKARSLSVNLGLTPTLSSSGHRHQMQGISRRGDPYLRKQLIHGARSLLRICEKKPDDVLCCWAAKIKERRGSKIATVALANRLARLIWVLLRKRQYYCAMPV